jgi:hypothetical protein
VIDPELARQIGCVVNRMIQISESRLKGSMQVHFDGSGFLGKTITENYSVWRDKFSSEKVGKEIDEEELIRVLVGK